MSAAEGLGNRRILLVDDNQAIHADFRKVLAVAGAGGGVLEDLEAALFQDGPAGAVARVPGAARPDRVLEEGWELDSAFQGGEALEMVRAAVREGRPYALAFVDVRMPPGWDGVETIGRLWEVDPDLQCVIQTAFSDYSWKETVGRLGCTDRLLILKKPFDPIEVQQLATSLARKWDVTRLERARLQQVRQAEQEARVYAASLETVNHALRSTLATAEASGRARADFLVRMSQEVLSPLCAALRAAEGEEALDQAWLERVGLLCRDGGELRAVLRDLGDLAEVEAGALRPAFADCDPAELMRGVLESQRPGADAKGLKLSLGISTSLPAHVRTDPAHLARALEHLVRNAVTFTDRGEIRVTVETETDRGWANPRVVFRVADTGCGMTREKMGRLFEPFRRFQEGGEGGASRRGMGLGLSLSKRVAQMLGGDLTVEAEPGAGSAFTLSVAAAPAPAE